MLLVLFVLLASFSSLFKAAKGNHGKQKNKYYYCARTLNKIIYQPEACGQAYLSQVNKNLKRYSPLLFTDQKDSIIANFEQQYGVSIETFSPFSRLGDDIISCDTFVQGQRTLSSASANNFPFNEQSSGTFVSASITGYRVQGGAASLSSSTIKLTSPGNTIIQNVYNNSCTGANAFNVNFSDDGQNLNTPNCGAQLNSGQTFKPTQPFATFDGTQVQGSWSVAVTISESRQLQGFNLTICYSNPNYIYPRDIAYSNLNSPAFSRENGLSKLSSIYRNTIGEELYVSITSDNLSC